MFEFNSTPMHAEGFQVSIQNEFQKCMKELDWLKKTWQQLQKDFALSGLSLESLSEIETLAQIHEVLVLKVAQIKSDNRQFEQLLYRIDLPKKLDATLLEVNSLAEVMILRSFQKVWLRKYYSNNSGKRVDK
jgi:hypothetical protein